MQPLPETILQLVGLSAERLDPLMVELPARVEEAERVFAE
jgi:hypothetical protein